MNLKIENEFIFVREEVQLPKSTMASTLAPKLTRFESNVYPELMPVMGFRNADGLWLMEYSIVASDVLVRPIGERKIFETRGGSEVTFWKVTREEEWTAV